MIGLGFLNPALLWALPIVAVPIAIHLLNRRRFDRVQWAAMEYLLAALKRNRRRLRMEQWLVLLLRTLAVLLLVFLVSRPQDAGSVLGEVRRHHVVCLDDSASMAHRAGAKSAFDHALERIKSLVAKLVESNSGDTFSLLRASRDGRPDLLAMRIGPQLSDQVAELLAGFSVGDGRLHAARLLREAHRQVIEESDTTRAQIYWVSDFRRVDWLGADDRPKPDLLRSLMELDPENHRFAVLTVGSRDAENLAITLVKRAGRIAIAGVPIDLTVEVTNTGVNPSSPVEVSLRVGDDSQVVGSVAALGPGSSQKLPFTHTFYRAGSYGVAASLPADRYRVDDRRGLALEVRDASRVLLVDGDPGDRPEEAETYFLATALEHEQSGISITKVSDHALADQDLAEIDLIYMCNVPAPDTNVAAKLEEFVAGGGGLVFFVGNQVEPSRYNELLFKGGEGVLPAALGELAGDIDRPRDVFVVDKSHPVVALAADTLEMVFARLVQVGRYYELQDVETPPFTTILRIGGSDGPPLLISRSFAGGGEVMLVTTTADIQWNSWPKTPAFLIVAQEMHHVAARVHDPGKYNLGPDGQLQIRLDPARYRPDVLVRPQRLEGLDITFTSGSGKRAGDDRPQSRDLVTIPMAELPGSGLFDVTLSPHAGGVETRVLAKNPPLAESQLARLSSAGWRRAYPEELHGRVDIIDEQAGSGTVLAGGSSEMWRYLALGMLGVMLLESLLAWRFGRR